MDAQRTRPEAIAVRVRPPDNVVWLISVLGCQLLAFWPSWEWLFHRVVRSPGDALGLLAVLAAVVGFGANSIVVHGRIHRFPLVPVTLFLVAYGTSFLWPVPPILRAALALSSVFLTLHYAVFGRRPPFAYWGMALIALPVLPSLQFYLGYPARWVSAKLTVPMLRMNGVAVRQEGTYLVWQDRTVQFDAPCSGVTMLWAAVLLTLTVAWLRGFGACRTVIALAICSIFVLFGNVLRAGSLFYLETGLFVSPVGWAHEAIGIVIFVFTAILLMAALYRMKTLK